MHHFITSFVVVSPFYCVASDMITAVAMPGLYLVGRLAQMTICHVAAVHSGSWMDATAADVVQPQKCGNFVQRIQLFFASGFARAKPVAVSICVTYERDRTFESRDLSSECRVGSSPARIRRFASSRTEIFFVTIEI